MSVFEFRVREVAIVLGSAALIAFTPHLQAQGDRLLSGKVVMEDGSPPSKPVVIMRSCGGRNPVYVASTNKQGEFRWYEASFLVTAEGDCIWRAVLAGFASDELNMGDLQKSDRLQDIVLRPEASVVPAAAGPSRARAYKAMQAKNWTEAEGLLRKIVAQYPRSAPVWEELGFVLVHEKRPADARPAFERAVALAPGYLQSYSPLVQLQIDDDDYPAAEKTALAGTQADVHGTVPGLYLDLAEIRVHLKEDGAEAAARRAIALDHKHALPRAEYVLGLILAEGDDYASAIAHLRRYLELQPRAPEAVAVRSRIETLQASAAAEAAVQHGGAPLDRSPEGATLAAVPGGLQALAAVARLKSVPAPADFFLEYCRAIADDADRGAGSDDPGLADALETYLTAAAELSRITETRSGRITLSPDALLTSKTATVLKLFGWKSSPKGGAVDVEIGEAPADSPRQQIPAALGVDEVEVAKTLASGASYHFEIHSAEAPVLEARAWRTLAGGLPPGGFAEIFIRNPHYAAAYAGLAAMGPGAASALISGTGLRVLVTRYSDLLRLYGASFAVSGDRAAVPGGPEADAAWERLAGAGPRDPKAFFSAVLAKDQGKLAAFYSALAGAGAARQRFFTRTADTAERFYKWYRDSDDARSRFSPLYEAWRQKMFRELPLDANGGVRFPGGKAAWTNSPGADADILTAVPGLQALVPVANLEQARKAPFDEVSAHLLADHYASWRPLFPYFENLPYLGRAEFEALAAFEKSASARPPDVRNTVLGEWHSLVKLLELGTHAASLDDAGGARAFRRVCEALSAPDYSARSLAALREMTRGADDLDEAVPAALLHLRDERRASFERVKALQKTPPLEAVSGDSRALEALTGQVYAALLDPEILLVDEDSQLAVKHAFLGGAGGTGVFSGSSLQTFHHGSSSHFAGGFADFEGVAATLARDKSGLVAQALPPASPSQESEPAPALAAVSPVSLTKPNAVPPAPTEAVFRVSARLVEVYATVTEEGRFVDDLVRGDFTLLDNGKQVPFGTFENRAAGVTVALVLDTTGSMVAALPALKGSALKLIDDLRPVDTVAVYSFNESVSELQPFTTNKDLAKRAVLRTRASGNTGLHDALVRVARDLSSRPGKKAIVVFTDGADNSSALTADVVIRTANSGNVRVYTICQGQALGSRDLTEELANLARSTGGLSFAIENPTQIDAIFEHIAQDLLHGYFLAFQPAALDGSREWRSLQIVLRDTGAVNDPKVRARSGYFPGD